MADQQKQHVFISYVRENQEQVKRLQQDLEIYGVNVWRDRDNISPGLFWEDAIRKAILDGAFFIACFSKEYKEKNITHMNEELNLAIKVIRKRHREKAWFIPVVLSGDVPDWEIFPGKTLQDIEWVLLHEDWDAGIQKILSVIKPIRPDDMIKMQAIYSIEESQSDILLASLAQIKDKRIVSLITEKLKHTDAGIRRRSAKMLAIIRDVSATSALIDSLKDPDRTVRFAVVEALGEIGGKAALKGLIEALNDENEIVRRAAVKSIDRIGDNHGVPALIKSLIDKDFTVRLLAARVLGKFRDVSVVPALIASLKDTNINVRIEAIKALGEIGGKAALKGLIEALNDENKVLSWYAVDSLRSIGDIQAIPALIEAMEYKNPHFGWDGFIESETEVTKFEKLMLLGIKEPLKFHIVVVLGEFGDKSAVPALIKALKDKDIKIRRAASEALEKIGPEAVPALSEALKDEDKDVRLLATLALGNIGPEAKAVVPTHTKTLKNKDEDFRQEAASALKNK